MNIGKISDRAKQLKRDIPAIFLALKHPDTPAMAKMLAGITIGYALSPVDLIPDFIPVLGYLDDVILLPGLVVLTVKMIPRDVLEECRERAQGLWDDGKPRKWFYALPIIMLWVFIIWIIMKAIWL